jgi:hypothetical protein
MAVVAQEQMTPDAPEPARAPRRQRVVWPKPSQLRQSVPILRLLAEIWSIPQVLTVAMHVEGASTAVRVVLPDIDRQAQAKIYAAERQYLAAMPLHDFDLQVVPLTKARVAVPAPFEAILER